MLHNLEATDVGVFPNGHCLHRSQLFARISPVPKSNHQGVPRSNGNGLTACLHLQSKLFALTIQTACTYNPNCLHLQSKLSEVIRLDHQSARTTASLIVINLSNSIGDACVVDHKSGHFFQAGCLQIIFSKVICPTKPSN